VRHLAQAAATMRADDAVGDAEKVRPERALGVQLRPVAKKHDEHVVREVLDVARGSTESAQRRENIVELSIERLDALVLGDGLRRSGADKA
jgi:hypothetical protein